MFDDTTAHHSDSNSTVLTEAEPTTAEQPTQSGEQAPASAPAPVSEDKTVSEDRVIKGTVLKLTPTHVVVDIGAKSEGMLPLSEVLDQEGKPKFKPGDEIDVMRDKGEAEEGYINLSHQKAQRIHAW